MMRARGREERIVYTDVPFFVSKIIEGGRQGALM
jgi:hypothetical protein